MQVLEDYKYSSGDLRLAKTKDGKTTLYFYHGNSLIAEKTLDGKVRKVFTHDNRGVLGMTRYVYDETDTYKSKQNLYYMFDDLGSVTAITDDTGTPVQTYIYDAYGNVTNTQNDPINNFAFVGRYGGFRDWDTGLTQFLHRWYDSRDGRWLSRDPIGVDGGINLYNYTENNPVNRVDVTGLKPKVCCDIHVSVDVSLVIGIGAIESIFDYDCTDGQIGTGRITCYCYGVSAGAGISLPKRKCANDSQSIIGPSVYQDCDTSVSLGPLTFSLFGERKISFGTIDDINFKVDVSSVNCLCEMTPLGILR